VFKGAFKHLGVVTGIQIGTTIHNQKKVTVVINTLYNTDPFLSVLTGKATTGASAIRAVARTNAWESLILTIFNKKNVGISLAINAKVIM
jgi:hypothetical protein